MVKEIDLWTTEYTQQLPALAPTYAEVSSIMGSGPELSTPRHPVLEYTKVTAVVFVYVYSIVLVCESRSVCVCVDTVYCVRD